MSTPLANPRRTKLDVWPTWRPQDQDAQQAATGGDAAPATAEDDQTTS
ncbi:hypothetical protein [Actinomadura parmotrematis]|uniref:Uncharacterized protein n=1 Tax=Actinomadura parmotrematis TaxID=2864039 RepID=A0ABS7G1Q1_9ACTN|nr:hypothetical protein [Actinomadura parmotrematis]MBW8486634.1 hypothetical protein [Actinomadura parmotrematis]